jgi:hypothetical protein
MQVTAFSTPASPAWRWRICNYTGEMLEESRDTFPTIAAAVADGAVRLARLNADAVDRSSSSRGTWVSWRRR